MHVLADYFFLLLALLAITFCFSFEKLLKFLEFDVYHSFFNFFLATSESLNSIQEAFRLLLLLARWNNGFLDLFLFFKEACSCWLSRARGSISSGVILPAGFPFPFFGLVLLFLLRINRSVFLDPLGNHAVDIGSESQFLYLGAQFANLWSYYVSSVFWWIDLSHRLICIRSGSLILTLLFQGLLIRCFRKLSYRQLLLLLLKAIILLLFIIIIVLIGVVIAGVEVCWVGVGVGDGFLR